VLCGANGQPRSMAIGNTLMLLMKPPPAQGGGALSFPHPALPKWAKEIPSLCEGVARAHVAGAEALLKPVHALLRAAVRKRFRIDVSARHTLQAVVAHCRRRIQSLLHFPGIQQPPLIGRVSPDTRETVCLQFQVNRKAVCGSRILFLRRMH